MICLDCWFFIDCSLIVHWLFIDCSLVVHTWQEEQRRRARFSAVCFQSSFDVLQETQRPGTICGMQRHFWRLAPGPKFVFMEFRKERAQQGGIARSSGVEQEKIFCFEEFLKFSGENYFFKFSNEKTQKKKKKGAKIRKILETIVSCKGFGVFFEKVHQKTLRTAKIFSSLPRKVSCNAAKNCA